ncbi:MAG: Spx/MgsR family RNA polymerase-binding regulatory protein [Verrucomicrobiota bacterium]
MLKVYAYKNCSTCKNAIEWLEKNGKKYEVVEIRDTPPRKSELRLAVGLHGLRKLFNSSGQEYRSLKLKDKLDDMPEKEALELLSSNGNLVKRPFAIDTSAGITLVGFKEDLWKTKLK